MKWHFWHINSFLRPIFLFFFLFHIQAQKYLNRKLIHKSHHYTTRITPHHVQVYRLELSLTWNLSTNSKSVYLSYLDRNCSLQSYCGGQSLSQERSQWMTSVQQYTILDKIVSVLAQLSSISSTINTGKKTTMAIKRNIWLASVTITGKPWRLKA